MKFYDLQNAFFQFSWSWENCVSEKFKKTVDVTLNPLSTNPTKWSKILKQIVGNLPTNCLSCLSVFDHFVGLALKGLTL